MALPLEITTREVKRLMDAGETLFLIDVREPHEYATSKIEDSELIPIRAVPAELSSLEAKADEGLLVIYCHHGMRSLQVANWLREQGVVECQSMAGGIDAWSCDIDPSVPCY
jgi:rhodanese-related sulfurtransferase